MGWWPSTTRGLISQFWLQVKEETTKCRLLKISIPVSKKFKNQLQILNLPRVMFGNKHPYPVGLVSSFRNLIPYLYPGVYIHSFQLDSWSLNPKPLLHVTLELFLKTPFSIAVGGEALWLFKLLLQLPFVPKHLMCSRPTKQGSLISFHSSMPWSTTKII